MSDLRKPSMGRETPANAPKAYSPDSDAHPKAAPPKTKLLVAVHGIGDQTAYETIQSVALRVSAHVGKPVATPLGRFYLNRPGTPVSDPPEAMPQLMTNLDVPGLDGIGLAEAYWAPIPRQVATQKFILEETKRWARSIAGRVAYRGGADNWSEQKVEQLVVVLDEMVETIRILERLTYLAEKAGVFKFDLGKLLADFVGDVQLVADFQVYREKILFRFNETMKATIDLVDENNGEVYIVAHSEGTVVTFVALLEALANPTKYPWIRQIRGLMTIGSPIEVHHLLWPALWRDRNLTPSKELGASTIPWHNYMDYGDPIAYELTETARWLDESNFGRHLTPVTHAFSRYPLAGKAHVDYWNDSEVFGHFFETVVHLPRRQPNWTARLADLGKATTQVVTGAVGDVQSKLWVPTFTFVLPYLIVAGLLFGGAYVLEKAVSGAFGPGFAARFTLGRVTLDVLGIGSLMFGVTAAARLPRIAGNRKWTAAGWLVLVITIAIFGLVASVDTQHAMAAPLAAFFGVDAETCRFSGLPWSIGCASGTGLSHATITTGVIAVLVAGVSGFWTKIFARRGHYMLPAFGLVAAFTIVGSIWRDAATDADASLGGVLLAGVGFFYLWWLSALLFDLVFIWRRYARHSALREHLATHPVMRTPESRDLVAMQ